MACTRTITWGGGALTLEFRVGDLFDNKPLNTPKIASHVGYVPDDMVIDANGKTPYLSAVTTSNGVSGYSNMSPNNDGDVITLSTTTLSGQTLFYQKNSFIGRQQMQALKIKNKTLMGEKLAMFLIAVLKPQLQSFDYGNKLTVNKLLSIKLELPVTPDNQPDYDFMETFITAQEKLAVQRLSEFRKQQIEATKAII